MRFDSMIYTMGTALNHALESHTPVNLLICGQWLSGQVLAVDGHGVVLDSGGNSHAVLKVEDISAVQVMSVAPRAEEPASMPTLQSIPSARLDDDLVVRFA